MSIIFFDVDGCLIDKEKKPIKANIALLKVLSKSHKVFVWSGNGWVYVFGCINKLGIGKYINGILDKYNNLKPDITFDDQEIELGKLNIKL